MIDRAHDDRVALGVEGQRHPAESVDHGPAPERPLSPEVAFTIDDSDPVERVSHPARHRADVVGVARSRFEREHRCRLSQLLRIDVVDDGRQRTDDLVRPRKAEPTIEDSGGDTAERRITARVFGRRGIRQHLSDPDAPECLLHRPSGDGFQETGCGQMPVAGGETRVAELTPRPPGDL